MKNTYLNADIVYSTTSGEIIDDTIYDKSVVVTAIEFEKTNVKSLKTNISEHNNSFEAGCYLLKQLYQEGLAGVFTVSDGISVNGSELVEGFNQNNPNNIPVTGGLAADEGKFEATYVGLNEIPAIGNIVAIGFYGKDLLIGHASCGGWDEFGPERIITRSDKKTLYELDNKNALDLYKEYLGDYVYELPGSALLFPLSIRKKGADKNLVRTILNVNEEERTMTFAGNLPEGSKARLMKGNFDKLIEAATEAAVNSFNNGQINKPDLAILISCAGRKIILQERAEEEVEAAKAVFGNNTAITGFYSYGEISPLNMGGASELYNQTMTITTFTEV